MKRRNVILLAALFLLLGLQFFPLSEKNPPSLSANQGFAHGLSDDSQIHLLKNACYDCHSHETNFPWYTSVAPVSIWINGHIKGGRKKLNFSNWQSYDAEEKVHKLRESIEEIEDGHMPPTSYGFMHKEAALQDEEKAALIAWLKGML